MIHLSHRKPHIKSHLTFSSLHPYKASPLRPLEARLLSHLSCWSLLRLLAVSATSLTLFRILPVFFFFAAAASASHLKRVIVCLFCFAFVLFVCLSSFMCALRRGAQAARLSCNNSLPWARLKRSSSKKNPKKQKEKQCSFRHSSRSGRCR